MLTTSLGHDVVTASSAQQGLDILAHGSVPELIVSDYLMPGMIGADMALKVRERWPDLPVLIVIGFARLDDPALRTLAKPFTPDELAAAVSAVLGNAPRKA